VGRHPLSKLVQLLARGFWREDFGPAQQEEHPFLLFHRHQVDAARVGSQDLTAGGDEHGSRADGGQKAIQQFQIFHIIPDEEPLAMGREPALHGCNHSLLIVVISPWQLEDLGNLRETGDNTRDGLCPYPEDGAIFQSVSVGVLQRDLCLADATQSIQGRGLGEGDRLLSPQSAMQRNQNLLAPGKESVARERDVRDRNRRSQAGFQESARLLVVQAQVFGEFEHDPFVLGENVSLLPPADGVAMHSNSCCELLLGEMPVCTEELEQCSKGGKIAVGYGHGLISFLDKTFLMHRNASENSAHSILY